MEMQLDQLTDLVNGLRQCQSQQERISLLEKQPQVSELIGNSLFFEQLDQLLNEDEKVVLRSLIAIEQWGHLCEVNLEASQWLKEYRGMLDDLQEVERFYRVLGGVVGYHWTLLSLLSQRGKSLENQEDQYHPPLGIDISSEDLVVRQHLVQGLVSLPFLAEIYPVGGAADRLRLLDSVSGDPLPAACCLFQDIHYWKG